MVGRFRRGTRLFCSHSRAQQEKKRTSGYYENLVSGCITRGHYNASTNRAEAEVGSLGRLYLYQFNCCPFSGKVKAVLVFLSNSIYVSRDPSYFKKDLPNRRIFS
eukprot:UN16768